MASTMHACYPSRLLNGVARNRDVLGRNPRLSQLQPGVPAKITPVKRCCRASVEPSRRPADVAPPDVRKLASLARLAVTANEVENWTPKIAGIVGWFGKLGEIDVTDIPPATRSGDGFNTEPLENVLRPDEASLFAEKDAMWAAVPAMEKPYLRVPQIRPSQEES
eukprot:jgi/Mesvir1/13448/Mv16513-RA.1